MSIEEFRYDLLKSFHTQFAQNQNHHQNLFIQVVSILLTVIIGFGYTLFNFKSTGYSPNFSTIGIFEFSVAFTISELILTLGVAIVSNMAMGYRRDQLMNAKIREAANITADSANNPSEKNEFKIFAISYNPMKNYHDKHFSKNRRMFFDWMPNFHVIFSITFLVIQFLIILIYFAKLSINKYLMFHINNYFDFYSLICAIGIFFAVFSYWIIIHFHKKLETFYRINGMQELIDKK